MLLQLSFCIRFAFACPIEFDNEKFTNKTELLRPRLVFLWLNSSLYLQPHQIHPTLSTTNYTNQHCQVKTAESNRSSQCSKSSWSCSNQPRKFDHSTRFHQFGLSHLGDCSEGRIVRKTAHRCKAHLDQSYYFGPFVVSH